MNLLAPLKDKLQVAVVWFLLASLFAALSFGSASGQNRRRVEPRRVQPTVQPVGPYSSHSVASAPPVNRDEIETAMGYICSDRRRDPLGSAPIDLMQARPSLSLNHPDAMASAHRAQRLLPEAKELTIRVLHQLASEYGFSQALITQAAQRVLAVTEVKPDPDLRDNASVVMTSPKVINFGTIFLVGLPSDEGLISVLCHELTHIADGRTSALSQLFARIGRRGGPVLNMKITGQRAEELSCDLVGASAVQILIERQPDSEDAQRRFSRAIEHNCVDRDETDDEHLSPRSTMRALLSLKPNLTRTVIGAMMRVGYSRGREMNLIQMGSLR